MSETEDNPSGRSNWSFQVQADISNLFFFYADLIFFHLWKMLELANAIFLLASLRVTLSANLNLNLWDSLVSPFFLHKGCFHF